ncbi:MAG: biotin transporter BioY [Spirochaetia bacterium]|jgi:biotin transport system substrate-specific component
MSAPVLAEVLRPSAKAPARIYDAALIAGFSLVVAVTAQISIPLPFTPVPVTLQTLAVVLTGALLGSRRGTLAILLYLAEGFAGLPVFSLGRAGFIHLFGPTGGYLVGFIAAAWLTGFLVERRVAAKLPGALLVIILGLLVPYIPGVAWLGISAVGFPKAFVLGFLPFLVGDGIKVIVAVGVLEGANILGTKTAQRRQAR